MPWATHGGTELYYEVDGDGETVTFLGDLGLGAWQWGWQHAAVAGPHESLVLDTRGCGRSDAPPGPYDVATLAGDLEAVLVDADVRKTHLVGAGLGGMVALYAALSSSRVASLALVGTAATGGGFNPEAFAADSADADALRASLEALVSREFLDRQPDALDRIVEWRAAEDADPEARAAQAAAIERFDVSDRLHEVTVPALVVHGADDAVCPVGRGRDLAEGLPRGDLFEVDDAGHLVHVEASRPVNDRLLAHIESA